MVRQYKIHTALGAQNDEVIDVTNGKVRFYQPSNLGFTQTNSIAFVDNIGVIGNTNISQPDIQFKLETFGDNLAENYTLMRDFIQTLQAHKYITLEYQTEISQVYADLAISEVTKTEGYGNHGQFSETITFNVITKWYTYEQLTLKTFENSDVVQGVSKIYGGYLDNETPIENYNRLKASGSLNCPNLNLLDGTSSGLKTVSANGWGTQGSLTTNTIDFIIGQSYTYSVWIQDCDIDTRAVIYLFDSSGYTPYLGNTITAGSSGFSTVTFNISSEITRYEVSIGFMESQASYHNLSYSKLKLEPSSIATLYIPSSSELTTDDLANFFGYNYILNTSYKYYGEYNINRLSRWQIDYEIFSIQAILTPTTKNINLTTDNSFGIKFFDTDGNNYTSYLFAFTEMPEQISVNTDVNNESYTAVINRNVVNIFSQLDFQRFRTRIFTVGTMELQNLDTAVVNIKRKADFV